MSSLSSFLSLQTHITFIIIIMIIIMFVTILSGQQDMFNKIEINFWFRLILIMVIDNFNCNTDGDIVVVAGIFFIGLGNKL
ncbi:hypothetical protein DERP_012771 [Dermatophagoides pteronyssinus]|uniref:Uncharacterized protein n=1 Tax=Dermatophagoides pteronyssinus TaxID=6956 RepID=A0ABQ8JQI1_DERPT|nr:hypothetical protein DERP_012771 [Dermatophagoides pteronyssinus]